MLRLKKRSEFLAAARGVRLSRRGFVLQAIRRTPEDKDPARVGFTVTKKVGNAVIRNKGETPVARSGEASGARASSIRLGLCAHREVWRVAFAFRFSLRRFQGMCTRSCLGQDGREAACVGSFRTQEDIRGGARICRASPLAGIRKAAADQELQAEVSGISDQTSGVVCPDFGQLEGHVEVLQMKRNT